MAKDKITEYDATAANNTVIGDVNTSETMLPSQVNDAIREQMSHLKEALGSGTPLYVDQTNDRVGIGNTSPQTRLFVGDGSGTEGITIYSGTTGEGQLRFADGTSGSALYQGRVEYNHSTNKLVLGAGGTTPVEINSSGVVTTSGLDVSGTIKLDGNHPTSAGNVAIGDRTLEDLTTGANNTAIGNIALPNATTGGENVAVGSIALGDTTTGIGNVAVGRQALTANTTGSNNAGIGRYTLYTNTTGGLNTAVGYAALYSTTASNNTAVGGSSLFSNTTGTHNAAIGNLAGYSTTTGGDNVALGSNSFYTNTTGSSNTAIGYSSMYYNTTGTLNVAVGKNALLNNTTASENTAVGYEALRSNTTGTPNVAIGRQAMYDNTTGGNNVGIGEQAMANNTSGSKNTVVGGVTATSLTTGTQNTILGYNCNVDNAARVGAVALGYELATHAANNSFRVMGSGGVFNTGNTSSWNTTSDRRIKKNIADSTVGLAEINQIQVRTFEYRTADEITDSDLQAYDLNDLAINKTGTQVGCIAQELNAIIPSAVVTDDRGVYNVQDDELKWHMIKAIQELSAKVTTLETKVAALEGN